MIDLDEPPVPRERPARPFPWRFAAGGVAALLVVIVATATITWEVAEARMQAAPTPAPSASATPPSAWDLEQASLRGASQPLAGPTPAASDISLTPEVTAEHCSGSAGCTVELRLTMTYDGPELSPDHTFFVTYELTGDRSGPITGSFELTGGTFSVPHETLTITSDETPIAATVIAVE